jgi:spore coat polysaccharide biosynthesis protein SpsF (cytidylyltransferase family)
MNILVTVRYSSSRLPGKCLLLVNEIPVLIFLLRRLLNAGYSPIVCTSTDNSDDVIVSLCESYDFKVFRGDLQNKIARWSACCKEYGLAIVHIVDADDPFVDSLEINESIQTLNLGHFDLVRTSNRSDSGFASVGMTVSAEFLHQLTLRTESLESRDLDVIPWDKLIHANDKVGKMPDKFLTLENKFQLRLTLDYPEDYELILAVVRNLGVNASRIEIEEFLVNNPGISKLNSHRTLDFINNKQVQLSKNFGTSLEAQ